MVRSAVRAELQPWLRTRSRVDRLSHYEPLDAYEQFETYCSEGAEFGMMNPGIQAVQREAVRASVVVRGAIGNCRWAGAGPGWAGRAHRKRSRAKT